MGVSEVIGSDVPNLTKNVPKFGNDIPMVPKCFPRWGLAPNHFLMGFYMKLWTIHVQMGVSEAIGLDVPNLMKDVPNFVKNVPRVRKCILMWGSAPNNFVMSF